MSELYVDLSDCEEEALNIIFQQSEKNFSEFISLRIESEIYLTVNNKDKLIGYLINNSNNNSRLVLIKDDNYRENLIEYMEERNINYDEIVDERFINSIKSTLTI